MSKKTWDDVELAEKERLAQLYDQKRDLTSEATKINMKVTTLQRNIRFYQQYRRLFLKDHAVNIDFKDIPVKRYTDFVEITEDNVMVISDIEIPDHNPIYLLLVLLVAMTHGIRKLIIAGDLIATDQDGLNSWLNTYVDKDDLNYEDAIAVVVMILKQMESWFTDGIWIIEGNHDDRIARATKGEVHLGMLIPHTKAQYSRYSFMWVNTTRGPIKVVHPDPFSGDPVVLGQQLYDVEPRKCHYVIPHCHRKQIGWSKDGAFEIHAMGCGRDPVKTKYKARKVNKHKQWDSSFVMVKNGYFYDYDLKSTNWEEALGDLYEQYVNHPIVIREQRAA